MNIVLIHDHKRVDKVWACWRSDFGPCVPLTLLLIVNYVFSSKIRFILRILMSNLIHSLVKNWTREVNNSTCGPIKNGNHLTELSNSVRFLSYICTRVCFRGRRRAIRIFSDEWSAWYVAEVTIFRIIWWIRALQQTGILSGIAVLSNIILSIE